MPKKHQAWRVGDVFSIPLQDGRFGVAQIVGREPAMLNSVSIALFDQAFPEASAVTQADLSLPRVFSVLFSTRDLLDRWVWVVQANMPVTLPSSLLPYESTRSSGWVGAKMIGSATIGKFLNAFFGLASWDNWHAPTYLDQLLLSGRPRPSNARMKARDGSSR
jgi:hypothetical protein